LRGGAGDDFLVGGPGGDVFDYDADSVNGHDVIADFDSGADTIDLDALLDSQGVATVNRHSDVGSGGVVNIANSGADSVVTLAGFGTFSITVNDEPLDDSDFTFGTL